MGLRVLTAAAVLMAGAGAAEAQTYPPAVDKVIAEARAFCGASGFKVNHRGIERRDVFGRGRQDYILSDDSWTCEGMAAMFSGSGGSTHWIVSDIRGSHEVVFEELVHGIRYDAKGGLRLSLHGSACGRVGADGCQRNLRWNGATFVRAGR